jgi:hypothetical protein
MRYAFLILLTWAALGFNGFAHRHGMENGDVDKPQSARADTGLLSGAPGMEGGDVDKKP